MKFFQPHPCLPSRLRPPGPQPGGCHGGVWGCQTGYPVLGRGQMGLQLPAEAAGLGNRAGKVGGSLWGGGPQGPLAGLVTALSPAFTSSWCQDRALGQQAEAQPGPQLSH